MGYRQQILLIIPIAFGLLVLPASTQAQQTKAEVSIVYAGSPQDPAVLHPLEQELGHRFSSVTWYGESLDPAIATRLHNAGYIPEMTWQPTSLETDDASLQTTAQTLASLPFITRINLAPEMNGSWSPWYTSDPSKFIDFWRHVVQIFRDNGASNVQWIWSPNIDLYNSFTPYAALYPGDAYVDYLGLDGYNWGTAQAGSHWMSFSQLYRSSYERLTALSKKPILISEIASTDAGGDKATWIKDMFLQLPKFPQIVGLTWFDLNKETDWRIESSQASIQAFALGWNGPVATARPTPTQKPKLPLTPLAVITASTTQPTALPTSLPTATPPPTKKATPAAALPPQPVNPDLIIWFEVQSLGLLGIICQGLRFLFKVP